MLAEPNTRVRVAPGDGTVLEADAATARITPRIADAFVAELQEGALAFPPIPAPDLCRVEWLDDDGGLLFASSVEVASAHYFPLDALRGYGDGQDGFDELGEELLFLARAAATEVFEQAAHRSFAKRLGRTRDYGRDGLRHLAHNDVDALLTEGYALASDCQAEWLGEGERPDYVEYTYGLGEVPAQVSRAVLELAAYMLRPTNRPVGATGESTDAGYIHFTTAGRDGATDIPEVNAAVEQFGRGVHYAW